MKVSVPVVKVRWFNDACYQIGLPSGKTILVDPYIDSSPLRQLDMTVLERVDYVLISHTHFDHVMDLGKIVERFGSQVYVGRMSALELAKQFDLPGYLVNPCQPGASLPFDEGVLHCYAGKHTPIGEIDRPSHWPGNLEKERLEPRFCQLNMLGSNEYINYVIELPQHFRILIWGGGATKEAVRQAADYRPNLSIAQMPRETPRQIAALYKAIGGQFIFPHHHDSFLAKGPEGEAVVEEVAECTARFAPETRLICPKKGVWYVFSAALSCLEEEENF